MSLVRHAARPIAVIIGCLWLTVYLLGRWDNSPASLSDYPDGNNIAADVASANVSTGSLARPPLRIQGRYIVDRHDKRFKLMSVNWYGASDIFMVPGGLDVQHRSEIARTIRDLGFNSVRLPYADEMVRSNPKIDSSHLAANADLVGFRALDVFGAVIDALTEMGIAVIVNNHITKARWCCDANLCDARWMNSDLGPFCPISQNEENWIRDLETVMRPHIDNPLVVGIDLRNEVRGATGKWLWNSWASAAEKAAERLHLLQPEWLIVVEGVSSANDASGARNRPVRLGHPDKLVYSVHIYGWSGWGSLVPYWYRRYESFEKDMHHNWEFLLAEDIAPVWVGESGAPANPANKDLHYWKNMMRYLRETDVDFGYWALNPRKPQGNEVEGYGLLEDDWHTPIYDYRLYDMGLLRPKVV